MRLRFLFPTRLARRFFACSIAIVAMLHAVIAVSEEVSNDSNGIILDSVALVDQPTQSVTIRTCAGLKQVLVLPQDEIWIVSTRNSNLCCDNPAELETKRLLCSEWQTQAFSDLADRHQQDPDHVTMMVIHGNNTNEQWAVTRGMQFYEHMFGQSPCNRPPIRLIIFEWEAEKVLHRPTLDYKLKSARAVALGPSVGSMLNKLGGERPVIVGYSLGAQIALSTLTQLASCNRCAGQNVDRSDHGFHVALIAPALDAEFACSRLNEIPFNPMIRDTEIFINRHDRVALAARLLNRQRCSDENIATSITGLSERGLFDSRFHLNDVTREVRNRHSLVNYVVSDTLKCRMRDLVARAAAEQAAAVLGTASQEGAASLVGASIVRPAVIENSHATSTDVEGPGLLVGEFHSADLLSSELALKNSALDEAPASTAAQSESTADAGSD